MKMEAEIGAMPPRKPREAGATRNQRAKEGVSTRALGGVQPADTLILALGSRNLREHISTVLSYPVCGHLGRQT